MGRWGEAGKEKLVCLPGGWFPPPYLANHPAVANQSLRPGPIYAIMNDIVYGGEGN